MKVTQIANMGAMVHSSRVVVTFSGETHVLAVGEVAPLVDVEPVLLTRVQATERSADLSLFTGLLTETHFADNFSFTSQFDHTLSVNFFIALRTRNRCQRNDQTNHHQHEEDNTAEQAEHMSTILLPCDFRLQRLLISPKTNLHFQHRLRLSFLNSI